MHDGIPLGVAASEAWASVPHPVLVVDRDGIVGGLSDTARAALPDVSVGTALQDAEMPWLARAHRDFLATETDAGSEFRGDIGAQEFTAQPTTLPDGQVAWWLMARPDAVLRQTQVDLARERERAAVLDEASAVLMASLNLERCMAATVRLAPVHLADAAVLVAPASEHRLPVVCCGPDGSVEQRWVEDQAFQTRARGRYGAGTGALSDAPDGTAALLPAPLRRRAPAPRRPGLVGC